MVCSVVIHIDPSPADGRASASLSWFYFSDAQASINFPKYHHTVYHDMWSNPNDVPRTITAACPIQVRSLPNSVCVLSYTYQLATVIPPPTPIYGNSYNDVYTQGWYDELRIDPYAMNLVGGVVARIVTSPIQFVTWLQVVTPCRPSFNVHILPISNRSCSANYCEKKNNVDTIFLADVVTPMRPLSLHHSMYACQLSFKRRGTWHHFCEIRDS